MSIERLKQALIDSLVTQVEEGTTILNKDGETEKVSCPASVLAVAAKVVKDFHSEIPPKELTVLKDAVDRYRLVKGQSLAH